MVAAHAGGYWLRFHWNWPLRANASFFAGCVLFGSVLLVSLDHYFADTGSWPIAMSWSLLVWSAAILPLGWVLDSLALLILANLLGAGWVLAHVVATGMAASTSLFVIECLCLLRWAYTNRSRTLFVVTLGSLVVWWAALARAEGMDRSSVYWLAAIGPLLLLIALRHDDAHPFARLYAGIGIACSGLVLLVLSLPSVSRSLMAVSFQQNVWLLVGLSFAIIILYVPTPRRIEYRRAWPGLALLTAVTGLPAALNIVSFGTELGDEATWLMIALFNAGAVAVAVWLIVEGAGRDRISWVAGGVAYFVIWCLLISADLAGNWTQAAAMLAVASAAILIVVRFVLRRQVAHEAVSVESV
jgi:hypothetical protein